MEYENRKNNPTKTITFILIGGALIVLADLLVFGGAKNIWLDINKVSSNVDVSILREHHSSYMDDGVYIDPMMFKNAMTPLKSAGVDVYDEDKIEPIEGNTIEQIILAQKKAEELDNITPAIGVAKELPPVYSRYANDAGEKDLLDVLSEINSEIIAESEQIPKIAVDIALPKSEVLAYEYSEPKGHGMIAIIIDDMGISLRSKLVEVLPAPLTLSYLPYAKNLKESTARAAANGHELMVHIPMQAIRASTYGGPRVLKSSQDETTFMNILDWGLSQFDGFVGVNNHMGSKLTQDSASMKRFMSYLKDNHDGIYFVDSKTIGSSVAAASAHDLGVSYNERDIFLDHEISKEFIEASLAKLEAVANRKGYAVAIGHPHKETIAALKAWLPTLEGKGLTLVPMSRLVKHPDAADDNLVAGR